MSEFSGNQLKDAIQQNRDYREMERHEVSEKLGMKVSKTTVRTDTKARNCNRVKSTMKLDLTDVQEAQRYEIALSRKDWTLNDWKMVVFTDEAAILVGEHRGKHLISRTPEDKYHKDCIKLGIITIVRLCFGGRFRTITKGHAIST